MRQIEVVGRTAWQPWQDDAFARLEPAERQLAVAILRYLHDLHLGLTPRLAAGLARALDTDVLSAQRFDAAPARRRHAAPEERIWAKVFEGLETELVDEEPGEPGTAPDAANRRPRRHTGLAPGAAPFFYVTRIAVPLVSRACEQVGRTILFSANATPAPASFRNTYVKYSEELNRALLALAEKASGSAVFWAGGAFTLSRLSRVRSGVDGVPDVDATALAQLLRLAPELEHRPPRFRAMPRRLSAAPRYRPLLHRNEGGVDGIHHTRRLADLSGILKSEFVNPKELVLERLLQSGYLALRRPPLREKKRDVLVAGVLPRLPGLVEVKRGLLKAAWFDAAARLSIQLTRSGLRRSEFRWIEADRWGRQHTHRGLLEELLEAGGAVPEEGDERYRRAFLAGLGWLPGYLDRHGAGTWLPDLPDPRDAVRWSTAAWRAQRDHPLWHEDDRRHPGDARAKRLDAMAYGTVHVMLFLPRGAELEERVSLAGLLHGLGLPAEPGYSVGVTWVPVDVADRSEATGWGVTAGRGFRPALDETASSEDAGSGLENRVAGALVGLWLETLWKELYRDD